MDDDRAVVVGTAYRALFGGFRGESVVLDAAQAKALAAAMGLFLDGELSSNGTHPPPAGAVPRRLADVLADESVMRPPMPVVPRLAWAGRSTLIAASEKSGKSTLAGYVAAQVSTGGSFLGDPCQRGPVLLVGLEESLGDLARRLRHFHADESTVYLLTELPGPADRLDVLAGYVRDLAPRLVVVDTLMAYAEGRVMDANAAAQMQPVVQGLTRLAHERDVALLLLHHSRKSDGRYRDSSAIGGAVDAIVEIFAPDEDKQPKLRRARARGRMPMTDFQFVYDGYDYRLPEDATTESVDKQIVAYVRQHPRASVRDLCGALPFRHADIYAAVTRLLSTNPPILTDAGGNKGRNLLCTTFVPAEFLT